MKGIDNMIQETYMSYVHCASALGDYQSISKTDLANGYVDAEESGDEAGRGRYISALMLRYWYKIFEWAKDVNLKLDLDDYASWLYEAIQLACQYKRWRNPSDKLYNDPNGPDKVFNTWFNTIRLRHYDIINTDKRRINYYAYSMEESIEIHGDAADVLNTVDSSAKYDDIKDIIQSYIDSGKILEAAVLNNIINGNVFDESRKTVKTDEFDSHRHRITYDVYQRVFNMDKLIASVKMMGKRDNAIEFEARYDISHDDMMAFQSAVKKSTKRSIRELIEAVMEQLRKDGGILAILPC